MRIPLDQARTMAQDGLQRLEYDGPDSRVIADHLIDCELRGLEYSGVARVLSIGDRLAGSPPAAHAARLTRESPVSAQIDGADRVGYLVSQQATRLAIDKARTTGIGAVGANNTWYTGMLSYYAEQIVAEGMVAIIASNATPWVAPYGGSEPRFGTNPICVAFPSTSTPVIWDIGISEIIHAQAVLAHRTGQKLPEGVAYDAAGHETRDPVAALTGAFVNWGGYRGSGLGIVVQLLGVMAGSPIAPGQLEGFGFFVLAIRPDLFVDPQDFQKNVADYSELIAQTRPTDSSRPVRMPFTRSAALRAERLRADAVDVDPVVFEGLQFLINPRTPDQRSTP